MDPKKRQILQKKLYRNFLITELGVGLPFLIVGILNEQIPPVYILFFLIPFLHEMDQKRVNCTGSLSDLDNFFTYSSQSLSIRVSRSFDGNMVI